MRKLPKEEVPKNRSDGSKFRARQIMYQLPYQDFNSKYAKFLKEDSKHSSEELKRVRINDALGVGKLF